MSVYVGRSLLSYYSLGFKFRKCISQIMSLLPNIETATEANIKKRSLNEAVEDVDAKKQRVESDRVKRKKVAMLLSYSGQGYFGMQRNPEMKTIEEDLLVAMLKANLITEEAFSIPQTVQFQRAARTDKGVSAARQVISVKLPEEAKVDQINEHLPEQIRALAIKRTTKGFNCKSSCDARTYSYMLPTFTFTPEGEEPSETYRITPEVLANVNETLKIFEGTHNFHNFTSRRKPLDPSANRYIMSFECGEPFLCRDVEFSVVRIKGQSFMLHQIRKMVGLTIAVARGLATRDTIPKAWKPERLDIPVAPGLGLVLEEVHYDRYNQRFGKDGIHEPLEWVEVEDQIKAFKEKYIFPTIVQTECDEKPMLNWLQTLPLHSYDVRGEVRGSQGLTALGVAAELVEGMSSGNGIPDTPRGLEALGAAADLVEGNGVEEDGLQTLARAAQAVQEERFENGNTHHRSLMNNNKDNILE